MSEAIFNRLVAIIETGTYNEASLSAKALRTFPDSLDAIPKPCVLILPRADTGWQKGAGHGIYQTTLSYDLYFYIKEAKTGNDAIGIADAINLNFLATQIFLSRPQLQLSGQSDIVEIVEETAWQTTSNLFNPISYPIAGVSIEQGAKFYWGWVSRLTVPYRTEIVLQG